jgi:hypothetical protein
MSLKNRKKEVVVLYYCTHKKIKQFKWHYCTYSLVIKKGLYNKLHQIDLSREKKNERHS